MKTVSVVSSPVLLFDGLVLLILGARVWSAPDVFAHGLGQALATQPEIDRLSLVHGASFAALGMAALLSAFTPPIARWLTLLLLTALGVAAAAGLWTLTGAYAVILAAVLVLNLLCLVLAFPGSGKLGTGDQASAYLRWG